MGLVGQASADTLLTWDVTGTTGTSGSGTAASLSVAISGSAMTAGAGTTAGNINGGVTSPANTWNRTYPLTADAAAAQAANEFVYWTTTVAEGYTVSITSFTGLSLAKTSSAGPTSAELYYSTDGTNFTKVGGTFTITSALTSAASTFAPSSAISVTGATGGTIVTWRLVSYSGLAGRMGIGSATTDNFSILGTVTGGSAKDLTWGGGAGAWNTDSGNLAWKNSNNVSTAFATNDNATINGGTLTVTNIGVTAGSVAVGGVSNTTISGGSVTGTTLTKSGSGALTLGGANTFSGGVTATGGTLTVGANGALGAAALTLNGATLSVLDSAVTNVANATSVGTNDASISIGLGASPTWSGAISAAGTTNGGQKGDSNSFNILNKLGAGTLVLTNSVGTQMSYDTTNKVITTAGAIQLNIASGGSVVLNGISKTMNLGSGVITDTFDTNTVPPTQLTTYNGMVWDGDFYLQAGTVQINGGNIRGAGTIYVTGAGTFGQRLNFNSPDVDNNVDVASGSTLTLSAASGGSIKFNGLLTGSGTVANTGSGGAVFGNTNPSTFTGTFTIAQTSASSSGGMTVKAQTLAAAAGVTFSDFQVGIPKLKIENSSTTSGAIVACPITGPGILVKAYDGDVVLTGENTFSGGLQVTDAGTLRITNINNLGSGPLTAASADARIGLADGSPDSVTINNEVSTGLVTISTNTNTSIVTTNIDTMAFTAGTNALGARKVIQLDSLVSGAGILKASGSGDLYVNNAGNTYTGGTEIGTGYLVISNPAVLSTGPVNFGTSANSFFRFIASATLTNLVTISGIGGDSTNVSVVKYTANFTVDAGLEAVVSSTMGNKHAIGTNATDQKYGGRFEKWGAGTLVLSASNALTESVTLNEGVLTISNANAFHTNNTINFAGGTMLLGQPSGELSVGDLTVVTNSLLNLGTGASRVIRFSGLSTALADIYLTVTNNSNGSLYLPITTAPADLAQLKSAENPTYTATINPSTGLLSFVSASTPTITVAGTPLASFSATQGTASAPQTFTAGGSSLIASITVSAPSNFEVSTNGSIYSSSVTLTPSGGAVSATTIYVRIAANAAVGSVGGNVMLSSTGATGQNVAVSGSVQTLYQSWSGGTPLNPTNLGVYTIGGATSPTATNGVPSTNVLTSSNLSIIAIVRTNDPTLTVYGQSATNLSTGPWQTNDVTKTNSLDQTGMPANCARQIFSTPRNTDTKKFLRIQSTLPAQ